jgi:hypothetical protein
MHELDPALIQQAQLLGQRRTPTKAEQREMEKANIILAAVQVGGTALSSLCENSDVSWPLRKRVQYAQDITHAILDRSEESKDDFDGNVQMRKLRNQLAAQLVYSRLRGLTIFDDAKACVAECFEASTKILTDANVFAEKEVGDEKTAGSSTLSSS